MELWDAYDARLRKIEGKTLVRGEPVPEGVYHLVCDIIVRHADGSYLLMKRDPNKHWGGMWEATAGGSALQGETPFDCAVRELREETGIITESLRKVGRVVSARNRAIFVEFLCQTHWDKANITLQKGETCDFRWVSRETLLAMKREELVTERMQTYIGELQAPDLTLPCGDGMVNIRVGAIIQKGDRFLMVQNERAEYLYSVGGRVRFGESMEQAVVREVREETGVEMTVDHLGFVHENFFIGDAPPHLGSQFYEISFYFYMNVPKDFAPISGSLTSDGCNERLVWATRNDPRTIFPEFFRNALSREDTGVRHIVTREWE